MLRLRLGDAHSATALRQVRLIGDECLRRASHRAAGPRLASIDLNPVFAMPEGHGAFAVDAVIEVG